MVDDQEYKGFWWSPADEATKLAGTLSVAAGRPELEVLGDFGRELLSETAREKTYSLDLADQSRILGVSSDGKEITLEELSERGHTMALPGLTVARYRARAVVVGKHFPVGDDVTFDEISIRTTDLNTWTRVSGFERSTRFEQLDDHGSQGFSGFALRYEAPDDIRIPLANGEEAFIRFSVRGKGLLWRRSDHVDLTQEAALHLRFAKKSTLRDVFRRVNEIRNFLSLAIGRPVSVLSVSGYRKDFTQGKTAFRRPIQLYWPIQHNPEPPVQALDALEMFFTLQEARPDLATVMKRWFRRQPQLEPVFNLYFGTLYHPSLYLEVRFLAYAQAIETYDYRRRRKHSDKHLADRMTDVLAQCQTVSKRITGAKRDEREAFIADFRNARNYYTHYNPKLEKKAARGTALLLLSIQLQAIIEMSLLRQLGFPCQAIDEVLARARRYDQIENLRSQASS